MKISFTKKQYISFTSVAVMLIVWKILAIYFDSDFIVPQPEDTFLTVVKLFGDSGFIRVAGTTILRGVIGFIVSGILGMGIGILAGISSGFNAFINPMLVSIRSTPVIALILLALIWFNPNIVPIFIAMLTMFPFICTNVVDGIRSVDNNLIEMARFYRVGKRRIITEVYIGP